MASLLRAVGLAVCLTLIPAPGLSVQASTLARPGDLVRQLISQHIWLGPDDEPLPFQSHDEVLEFLQSAKVVSSKKINIGVNGILKVLLELNGVQMNAGFRTVRIDKQKRIAHKGHFSLRFRDDASFEAAAYRLSRMLGLNAVPPTVVRKLFGKTGTLQAWVENAMMEKERQERSIGPPIAQQRVYQLNTMRLFDSLIFNDDRNQGNILWDPHWKLWMIDHTRSFRRFKDPLNLELLRTADGEFYENLRKMEPDTVRAELKDLLEEPQIRALLARRARIVDHFEELIQTQGEEKVLF